MFSYLFWPNPGTTSYSNPKVVAVLFICGAMLVASSLIKRWRLKQGNPVTKRLSKSWATASLWFGVVGLVLAVSRVEGIQFIAMRLWWLVWGVGLLLYVALQIRIFRARHYEILPQDTSSDPRAKYLPKQKKR
jgi:hypothetical protein